MLWYCLPAMITGSLFCANEAALQYQTKPLPAFRSLFALKKSMQAACVLTARSARTTDDNQGPRRLGYESNRFLWTAGDREEILHRR